MEKSERSCCGEYLPRAAFAVALLAASVPTWTYVAITDVCGLLVSLVSACEVEEQEKRKRWVLPDVDAVLKACREAGIADTNDRYRRACVGMEVVVMKFDASDDTVMCYVPVLDRDIWFAERALIDPSSLASSKDFEQLSTLRSKLAELKRLSEDPVLGELVVDKIAPVQGAVDAERAHGAFVGRAISLSWQCALWVCWWLRVDTSGLRPLDDAGRGDRRLFICANHASYLDTVMICAYMPRHLVGDVKTLMAQRHLDMPVLGRIAHHVGHMPVPYTSASRGNYAKDATKMAALMADVDRSIEGGDHLAIFPEGDLNKQPHTLLPFRAGGMEICIRHDMEVWAWVMTGPAECWPEGEAMGGLPASIQMRAELVHRSAKEAAESLAGPGASPREGAVALAADLRTRMQVMLDDMLQEAMEDSTIPRITYDFKPLADIAQSSLGTLIDIRAVAYHVGETSTFIARPSNTKHTMRRVCLWDDSGAVGGCFVDLVLWGESAQQGGFEVGSVVLLKHARVAEDDREGLSHVKTLSTPRSFEIDLDDWEGLSLKARFDTLRSQGGRPPAA